MQSLWSEKLGWDDTLPKHLSDRWFKFLSDLPNLRDLSVNRKVVCDDPLQIELHGYCDASERAYGACVYVRSIDNEGKVHVHLLAAKSKVAPIKTISIPCLELCGALVLSRLIEKIRKSLTIKLDKCFLWCDSQITLAWINTSPNLLKVFVANRVAEIQGLSNGCEWRYVPTQDNPADLVTRGLYPGELSKCLVWWQGPTWLGSEPHEWPISKCVINDLPELRQQTCAVMQACIDDFFPFENFSSYTRLLRSFAYILRFIENCKRIKKDRISGFLSKAVLDCSRKVLVKMAQKQSFSKEISSLSRGSKLDSKSKLLNLTPFLDTDNIMRVGGRLEHSALSFHKKHPVVLDSLHPFTKLLFAYKHLHHLHVGPQNLLAFIREEFWPIGGRSLARSTVRRCVKCARFRSDIVKPLMGNLPRERIVPSSPFSCVGVDYAGPFTVRHGLSKGRSGKLEKCYIGLFICFSTKAVHLELVSSLSTESFLQALRRFVSRRGKPSKIVSDNGKNVVGAFRELGRFLLVNRENISSLSASEGIDWQFIPPYSPHMGGLWESNVRCVKSHLRHVFANACLIDTASNRLTRFQLMQRICQHFWKRWERDYILELQRRQKWKTSHGELSENQLVLIKDDQSLPTEWRLGRIVGLHKGQDGIARVASIKTSAGVLKRNFQKICLLPVEV